jgi:hypothetical protein
METNISENNNHSKSWLQMRKDALSIIRSGRLEALKTAPESSNVIDINRERTKATLWKKH